MGCPPQQMAGREDGWIDRILVASSSVKVSEAAVNALAAAVRENSESIDEVSAPFRPPLLFDSVEQEINFISTLSLLSFGTGYDGLLLPKYARGAMEMAQALVLGIHLMGKPWDAGAMEAFGEFQITAMCGVDGKEDREIAPGVYVASPGPLHPYVSMTAAALRGAGEAAKSRGKGSLGALVMGLAAESAREWGRSEADFVRLLVEAVPAFRDEVPVPASLRVGLGEDAPETVPFHARAHRLAAELHGRFAEGPGEMDFGDMGAAMPESGRDAIAALRRCGCMAVGAELEEKLDGGAEIEAGSAEELELRACAVHIFDRVSALSGVPAWKIARWMVDRNAKGVPGRDREDVKGPVVTGTTAF